jgi:hypothetical protein
MRFIDVDDVVSVEETSCLALAVLAWWASYDLSPPGHLLPAHATVGSAAAWLLDLALLVAQNGLSPLLFSFSSQANSFHIAAWTGCWLFSVMPQAGLALRIVR